VDEKKTFHLLFLVSRRIGNEYLEAWRAAVVDIMATDEGGEMNQGQG
jgi:hypothetical protein